MESKERLKKEQPVAYRVLSNALKRRKPVHAYLFVGPPSTPKTEAAILLGQSLLCEHPDEDGFACGKCKSCRQVEAGHSLDFIRFGHDERIRKKSIAELQDKLSTTSVSSSDYRVYLLENFDQATPEAANALLKFLEEPEPGICGMLTTPEISNVLPTISSRCQAVHLKPGGRREREEQLKAIAGEAGTILARFGYTDKQARQMKDNAFFEIAQEAARQLLETGADDACILDMQTRVFPGKGENTTKDWVRFFVQCLIVENEKLPSQKRVKLQPILVRELDLLNRPLDLGLFIDNLCVQIRRACREE